VLHHEGELCLDPGGDEAVRRHQAAIGKEHVVEQHTGIRLVDVERALHRLRGQPDLVALDDTSLSELDVDPGLLDRVSVGNRDVGEILRKLPDLDTALLRLMQAAGAGADVVLGKGHERLRNRDAAR
jgi:hypothetical protein